MTTGSMAFQIPVPIRGFGATTSLPMATRNSSRKTFGCISNKCYFPSWERTHIAMIFFKKSWFLLKSQIRAKNLGRFSIARLVSYPFSGVSFGETSTNTFHGKLLFQQVVSPNPRPKLQNVKFCEAL